MGAKHVKGLRGLVRELRLDFKLLKQDVRTASIYACSKGVEVAKKQLPSQERIKAGLESSPTETGARLVSTAPWSYWYEVGSRPHWAPFAPILEWAQRKCPENPWGFAIYTQRKIAEEGTQPKWFVRNSMPEIYDIFESKLCLLINTPRGERQRDRDEKGRFV